MQQNTLSIPVSPADKVLNFIITGLHVSSEERGNIVDSRLGYRAFLRRLRGRITSDTSSENIKKMCETRLTEIEQVKGPLTGWHKGTLEAVWDVIPILEKKS